MAGMTGVDFLRDDLFRNGLGHLIKYLDREDYEGLAKWLIRRQDHLITLYDLEIEMPRVDKEINVIDNLLEGVEWAIDMRDA